MPQQQQQEMPVYNKPAPSGPPRGNVPRPKFAAMNLPKATPPM